MRLWSYKLLCAVARLGGSWILAFFSRLIALGYFFFSGRAGESRRFYAALFPQQSRFRHAWYALRQYQQFTTIHLDRFLAAAGAEPRFTSQGWERLESVIGARGAILLMSHLGNWEMAARLLKKKCNDLPLLLYMGAREKEELERLQKEELRSSGVTIIAVDQEVNAPFAAIEAIRFLREGGVVSMAGDRLWRSDQRAVEVPFLGGRVRLPEAPYLFALLSGAPLFVFFAFRTGTNSYHFTLSEPIDLPRVSRAGRGKAMSEAATCYARLLEQSVREHPFQWYHFERFIQ